MDAHPSTSREGRRGRRILVSLALALGVGPTAACERAPRTAPALGVAQFRQESAEGVLLNEPLVVHLSQPVDPRSVTDAAVVVVADDGIPAEGELRVSGRRLAFVPRLPLDPGLDDGGLRPGRRYTLRLRGFPRVDALRSVDGAPLARTFVATFATASIDDEGAVLLDDAPERRARLAFERATAPAGEPWHVLADKAVDPRSLSDASFVLLSDAFASSERPSQRTIPLRTRLVEASAGHARIELMPLDDSGLPRLLDQGEYPLILLPGAAVPKDFGGADVVGPWSTGSVANLVVEAAPPPPRGRRVIVTFATTALASPRIVRDAVGQARWEGDGRVRLSCPRASGDGRDGSVVLAGEEDRSHVRATDLELGRAADVTLSADGAIVLAAQGRARISGRLERRVQDAATGRSDDETHQDWLLRLRESRAVGAPSNEAPFWLAFEPGETLSGFLERARMDGVPITCIVCGGDLVVDGTIDVDGPLLLVAGGRVRIPGSVRASEAWITAPFARSGVNAWLEPLPIEVDQPLANTLRRDQRWSIVTGPLRTGADFTRWAAYRATGYAPPDPVGDPQVLDHGRSRYELLFIGSRPDASGRLVETEPVEDLRLLEDCPIARVRIDLVVEGIGAGPPVPWDPPWLDDVELVWE